MLVFSTVVLLQQGLFVWSGYVRQTDLSVETVWAAVLFCNCLLCTTCMASTHHPGLLTNDRELTSTEPALLGARQPAMCWAGVTQRSAAVQGAHWIIYEGWMSCFWSQISVLLTSQLATSYTDKHTQMHFCLIYNSKENVANDTYGLIDGIDCIKRLIHDSFGLKGHKLAGTVFCWNMLNEWQLSYFTTICFWYDWCTQGTFPFP